VNPNFISASGGPFGLAVDSKHIYWVDAGGVIGRAKLDGTGVNGTFITGLTTPYDVAVLNDHIYWTGFNSIGRAKIDGTGVNQNFITGATKPLGVATYGRHIYWTNSDSGTIGRAKLDGSSVNQSFITGATNPFGIAVGGGYVFWANSSSGSWTSTGRGDLTGANVNQSFLNEGADGLATSYDRPPQTTITQMPTSGTTSTSATFAFKSNKAGSFQCKLDASIWASCTSPKTYTSLSIDSHTFQVRARDLAGKLDPTPAMFSWKIT
jgi:hypothetical protein